MKGLSGGRAFFERFGPSPLKVDCVGEDQTGGFCEAVRRKDILDFVPCLLCHPTIDLVPGSFGTSDEVSLVDVSSIIAFGNIREGRQKRMPF